MSSPNSFTDMYEFFNTASFNPHRATPTGGICDTQFNHSPEFSIHAPTLLSFRDDAMKHPRRGGGYQWTYPYCGKSRFNAFDGESGEESAINALRNHILTSDGAEHGPQYRRPGDDALTLSDHVEPVGEVNEDQR